MGARLHIQGEYPADWPEIGDRVRAAAGHRCIRCGHPYKTGEHGKGEWTPCDEQCRHGGPLGFRYDGGDANGNEVISVKVNAVTRAEYTAAQLIKENRGREPDRVVVAEWRILTVHHLDGDKSNCEWWNLLSLCQRCHLQIQTRLNPELPYFLEHSDWFKPYAAGFYAKKYEGVNLTREQVAARLDELLGYERRA